MKGENPFPGPYAFSREKPEHFYGRDQETVVLMGLAEARQASLLFSPSGAGKSSLINAGLVPRLTAEKWIGEGSRRRRFQQMRFVGEARVGGSPRDDKGKPAELAKGVNTFVYLALFSLGLRSEHARTSLADGLARKLDDGDGRAVPALLVFDQFEELFTHHVDLLDDRRRFFEQLRDALATHGDLHVLIAMREEFIAELTPYLGYLPERLQSRYRLERLAPERALEAIMRPAADAECPFASEAVAERLVNSLLGVAAPEGELAPAGRADWEPGRYVEPVHLQIVCHELWNKLGDKDKEIGEGHLRVHADVDRSLREFYEGALDRILALELPGVDEYGLRRFFDEDDLITPTGTRGLVRRTNEATKGLPNAAVQQLVESRLLRAVARGDLLYYEVAHDRLVGPIRDANRQWREEHLKPVTLAAENWKRNKEDRAKQGLPGDDPGLLWSGAQLRKIGKAAKRLPTAYSELEHEFIKRSRDHQRLKRLVAAAFGMAILLFVFVVVRGQLAERRAEKVAYLSSIRLARDQLSDGRPAAAATLDRVPEKARRRWEWRYLEARSRFTEIPPEGTASRERILDAAFSGALARPYVAVVTEEGTVAIWDPRKTTSKPSAETAAACDPGNRFPPTLAFSGDGQWLLTVCWRGPTRVWNTSNGRLRSESPEDLGFSRPTISFDGDRVLALSENRPIVWLPGPPQKRALYPLREREGPPEDAVERAIFTEDGGVFLGTRKGLLAFWDPDLKRVHSARKRHPGAITALAASRGGDRFASASGAEVWTWRLSTGGGETLLDLDAAPIPLATPGCHLTFSADGAHLLTVEEGRQVTVWSRQGSLGERWHAQAVLPLKKKVKEPPTFSPNAESPHILIGAEGEVVLWDWGSDEHQPFRFAYSESRGFPKGAFSPDGRRLLIRNPSESVVRSWDLDWLHRPAWQPPDDGPPLSILAAAPTSGGLPRGLTRLDEPPFEALLWEFGAEEALASFPGHEKLVHAIALSADGSRLVSSSGVDTIVWAADDDGWKRINKLATNEAPQATGADAEPDSLAVERFVEWVAFSPDAERIVTAEKVKTTDAKRWSGIANVWSSETGEKLLELDGHSEEVVYAAFGPEGQRVITTSKDRTARVWDTRTGDWQELVGHDGTVEFAAFSSDGRRVVTGSEDGTARLWRLRKRGIASLLPFLSQTPQEIGVLSGHGKRVRWAAFSSDGRRIATASDDGIARVWNEDGVELVSLPHRHGLKSVHFDDLDRLVVTSQRRLELYGGRP